MMRAGKRRLYLHSGFIVLTSGIFSLLLTDYACALFGVTVQKNLSISLLLFCCAYSLVTFIGVIFRRGPMKSIGIALAQDRKDELDELQPVQPWDPIDEQR